MGWFWADSGKNSTSGNKITDKPSECPLGHSTSKVTSGADGCPVLHGSNAQNEINPFNNMPKNLSHEKHIGQKLELPKDRTTSSIPKGNPGEEEFWEYPSPQQMYNAMIRKGKIDPNTGEEIPEDAVESMVFVHNFLNEGCWQEILDWEKKYSEQTEMEPKLLQFMGKPSQLSPRARCFSILGTLFPSKFSAELPFDRHDWVVLRPDPTSSDTKNPGFRQVRYVIDFYGGPDDEDGLPTFNLDVRPALDNFTNAKDRFTRWTEPIIQEYFGSDKK
ncbi:Cytochrome c heme lyase [Lachancea thermotolerans]|uniref:Holocytochrome c-type synthase n=1 Tax=Lachancea thermotolerans (strain ATCC 56472 / CBS 6340 / NRRL Y-8284) TaxID=559295 RepID=C5DG01_LACTC|nr:KLTH0D01320p [Lachancea thermotolerans CBS 6340]CAR22343.1 KLTH0D01320p [Lachancea thermotolerans CBS 6340]